LCGQPASQQGAGRARVPAPAARGRVFEAPAAKYKSYRGIHSARSTRKLPSGHKACPRGKEPPARRPRMFDGCHPYPKFNDSMNVPRVASRHAPPQPHGFALSSAFALGASPASTHAVANVRDRAASPACAGSPRQPVPAAWSNRTASAIWTPRIEISGGMRRKGQWKPRYRGPAGGAAKSRSNLPPSPVELWRSRGKRIRKRGRDSLPASPEPPFVCFWGVWKCVRQVFEPWVAGRALPGVAAVDRATHQLTHQGPGRLEPQNQSLDSRKHVRNERPGCGKYPRGRRIGIG